MKEPYIPPAKSMSVKEFMEADFVIPSHGVVWKGVTKEQAERMIAGLPGLDFGSESVEDCGQELKTMKGTEMLRDLKDAKFDVSDKVRVYPHCTEVIFPLRGRDAEVVGRMVTTSGKIYYTLDLIEEKGDDAVTRAAGENFTVSEDNLSIRTVESDAAALKRAKTVWKNLGKVDVKLHEIFELLEEAEKLASDDGYHAVSAYDSKDIRDFRQMMVDSSMKRLARILSRWSDIVWGRK